MISIHQQLIFSSISQMTSSSDRLGMLWTKLFCFVIAFAFSKFNIQSDLAIILLYFIDFYPSLSRARTLTDIQQEAILKTQYEILPGSFPFHGQVYPQAHRDENAHGVFQGYRYDKPLKLFSSPQKCYTIRS